MAAKSEKPKKDAEGDQPKVFQFSEAEMEKLLEDRDEIEAGVEKRPKKPLPPREKPAAAPAGDLLVLRKKAEERDKFLERLQRVQAEYLNYQKRTKREREGWKDQSLKEFLQGILPLLDDFDGAARTLGTGDAQALIKGIQILRDRLWKILSTCGVEEIPADGESFDPKIHEAVAQESSPVAEDGQILAVLQKGYSFKEWVLRASRVKIARRGEAETPPAPEVTSSAEIAPPPPAGEPSPPPVTGNPLLDEPEDQPHA